MSEGHVRVAIERRWENGEMDRAERHAPCEDDEGAEKMGFALAMCLSAPPGGRAVLALAEAIDEYSDFNGVGFKYSGPDHGQEITDAELSLVEAARAVKRAWVRFDNKLAAMAAEMKNRNES